MATPSGARPGRTIAVLAALIVLIYGLILVVAPDTIGKQTLSIADKFKPRLGLDLEGGTSVILTPRLVKGGGSPPKDSLNQAVSIIRNRVDSFGVAESEVDHGGRQHRHLDPRQAGQVHPQDRPADRPAAVPAGVARRCRRGDAAADRVPEPDGQRRRVTRRDGLPERHGLAAGVRHAQPDDQQQQRRGPQGAAQGDHHARPADARTDRRRPPPSPGAQPVGRRRQHHPRAGPAVLPARLHRPGSRPPGAPQAGRRPARASRWSPVRDDGVEKYILGPAEVLGTDVKSASAALETNNQGVSTGGWEVQLNFTGDGKKKFGDTTRRLAALSDPENRFGIVLDGLVVSAPSLNNGPILGGQAQITGNFSQSEATSLANVLKYGALPLTFDAGSVEEVSATLGGDQLKAGLVAGLLGLLLVVLYSLLYYRGLGLVTVASLVVSGIITYGLVVLLGWQIGFRLSLAGIAGLIVAIGITADSFVVYFERIRDEVRDGRTLRVGGRDRLGAGPAHHPGRRLRVVPGRRGALRALGRRGPRLRVHPRAHDPGRHRRGLHVHQAAGHDPGPHRVLRAGPQVVRARSRTPRVPPGAPPSRRRREAAAPPRRPAPPPAPPPAPSRRRDEPRGNGRRPALPRRGLLRLRRATPRLVRHLRRPADSCRSLSLLFRGLTLGIEFRGGAEFRVTSPTVSEPQVTQDREPASWATPRSSCRPSATTRSGPRPRR